jgi:hypothetical protein
MSVMSKERFKTVRGAFALLVRCKYSSHVSFRHRAPNRKPSLPLTAIMVQMSFFIVYLMGNVTTWRTAAAISASLPVITALYVTQVSEY